MGRADDDAVRAATGRKLAVISVITALAFIAIEFLGATLGWSNQIMGLLELGIAAVFIWIMVQAYRLWRTRQ